MNDKLLQRYLANLLLVLCVHVSGMCTVCLCVCVCISVGTAIFIH
jgi:hypothetical protein